MHHYHNKLKQLNYKVNQYKTAMNHFTMQLFPQMDTTLAISIKISKANMFQLKNHITQSQQLYYNNNRKFKLIFLMKMMMMILILNKIYLMSEDQLLRSFKNMIKIKKKFNKLLKEKKLLRAM